MSTEGGLRVWHIPQIPGKPFHVSVDTPLEAVKIINLLAEYDQFQFDENIKPDYSNVSGLEVYEDGEWCEWHSDNDEDIDEFGETLE